MLVSSTGDVLAQLYARGVAAQTMIMKQGYAENV